MYKFERYGILMWYNGIPIYAGPHLITKRKVVWWWPINWLAVMYVIFLMTKAKVKELWRKLT